MHRRDFIKLGALSIPAIGMASSNVYQKDDIFWKDVLKKVDEFHIQQYGKDISDHPALCKPLKFAIGWELFHVQVAKSWGCTPSELSNTIYDDKVKMYAWYISREQMDMIEHYELVRKSKKQIKV